jgi:hypothetical protein
MMIGRPGFLQELQIPPDRKGVLRMKHSQDQLRRHARLAFLSKVVAVTAPPPRLRTPRKLTPDRIQMQVSNESQQIPIPVTEERFVSSLENVTHGVMGPVEVACVGLLDSLHDLREWSLGRFEEEMHMIRHQDIGIEHELVPVLVPVEARQVYLIISLTPEHMPTLIPTSDDMVKNSWKLNAGRTSHARLIPGPPKIVNINISMSDPSL